MIIKHVSPLRYPGGKTALAPLLSAIMVHNDLHDRTLLEPFAGGAGAALRLLFDEYASAIVINDMDRRVAAFWKAAINQTDQLVNKVHSTPVTMKTWHRCREVYDAPSRHSQLDLAFSTFFLNRCNRSGILCGGGPIGGYDQRGKWKIDARYNAADLASRIERVAQYRSRIKVKSLDAIKLLRTLPTARKKAFVYIDPPYFDKGPRLYMNNMLLKDHAALARFLLSKPPFHWVLTYDNVSEIRDLYREAGPRTFELGYSAYTRRTGSEVLIVDPRLDVTETLLAESVSASRIEFRN